MANLPRWNPFAEFEDILNRYNRTIGIPGTSTQDKEVLSKTDWAPAVDITETKDAYLIKAEIPGLKREDVKVAVDDRVLTISGERQVEKEEKDRKHHRIERVYGSFARSFALPDNVDDEHIRAEYKDGILTLTLTKHEKAKPKAIEVQIH